MYNVNILKLLMVLLLLSSCDREPPTDDSKRDAEPITCTIVDSTLACTDGTVYALPRQPKDGKDADSCRISGQSIQCPDGSVYQFPLPAQGPVGESGSPGAAGSSCSIVNSTIVCTDGTSFDVPIPKDGVPGAKGDKGEVGASGRDSIVSIIDPCGPNNSGVDELLFVLSTGQLVAWYQNVGLVALKDGTYRVTDSSGCVFKIINGQYVGN